MTIPEEIINAVRERVSITEVISETVVLKRSGRHLSGLCPFHTEKTPSFFVREDESSFHCFGCGKSGSVFTFLMETRGFTFPEAVRFLAGKVGIEIPETNPVDQKLRDEKAKHAKELRLVAHLAHEVYKNVLSSQGPGKRGLQYLTDRGVSRETCERFYLGYSPQAWEFIASHLDSELKKRKGGGWSEQKVRSLLVELGLLKAREKIERTEDSPFFDIFRDRIIFPISRSDGGVIAFGGRTLGQDQNTPKYLNSKESAIYQKRKALYGLYQAMESLRKSRQAFLVEGYLDVLALSQKGFLNTVACCGTAVTEEHVLLLKRLVDHVTVIFDGDQAGRKAAASCFETFLNSGITVSVVLLDEGEDPDSLSQKMSFSELEEVFSHRKKPIVELYLEELFSSFGESHQEASAVTLGKVSESFVRRINDVKNPVEKELLLRTCSQKLGISEESLISLSNQKKVRPERGKQGSSAKEERKEAKVFKNTNIEQTKTEQTKTLRKENDIKKGKEDTSPRMSSLVRQLLVALVSEPRLAPSVLQMPSLLGGADFTQTLPDQVRAFIEELSQSALPGIAGGSFEDPKAFKKISEEYEEILNRFGFSSLGIIQEAQRQCAIGGVNNTQVIQDIRSRAARLSLLSELESHRLNEVPGELTEEHVQEKLRKKKALQDLARERS